MSFHEERDDEDMSGASSSSDESMHNVPPKISDATATFDPWYEIRHFLQGSRNVKIMCLIPRECEK